MGWFPVKEMDFSKDVGSVFPVNFALRHIDSFQACRENIRENIHVVRLPRISDPRQPNYMYIFPQASLT